MDPLTIFILFCSFLVSLSSCSSLFYCLLSLATITYCYDDENCKELKDSLGIGTSPPTTGGPPPTTDGPPPTTDGPTDRPTGAGR